MHNDKREDLACCWIELKTRMRNQIVEDLERQKETYINYNGVLELMLEIERKWL